MICDPDYARAFTRIRIAGWSIGYAVLLHGSATRDLDVLAVPWSEKVGNVDHLIQLVQFRLGDEWKIQEPKKREKPHSRIAVSFIRTETYDPRWIDLSIFAVPPDAGTR